MEAGCGLGATRHTKVYVLDLPTGAIQHTIDGFGMPYRIDVTPDRRTAVVSDPGEEKIHLVDVATHAVRLVITGCAAMS